MVKQMTDELKETINNIVENDLDKLSIDELVLLKNMIVYYDAYENNDYDQSKIR